MTSITLTSDTLYTLQAMLADKPDKLMDTDLSNLPGELGAMELPELKEIAGCAVKDSCDARWILHHFAYDMVPTCPHAHDAAVIRGELPVRCWEPGETDTYYDANGILTSPHLLPTSKLEVYIQWTDCDEYINPIVQQREDYDPSYVAEILPRSHAKHSLYALSPWDHSPISTKAQEDAIKISQNLPDDLRGGVLVGPAGSSKTALVSAWIKDEITRRLPQSEASYSRGRKDLGIYRIRVSDYLDAITEWEFRDWEDTCTAKPKLTPQILSARCNESCLRPILWLEELDKFSRSDRRVNLLNSLINEVYEREGLVIITSNETVSGLRKLLDESTLRRVTGEYDDPKLFRTFDFFAAPKAAKPKKQ